MTRIQAETEQHCIVELRLNPFLDNIIKQIRELSKTENAQQRIFYLEQQVSLKEMDAIESIFRHFQLNTVDVQRKLFDDSSSSALFDMLLFYESTSILNCSKNVMGAAAWISLSQLVKRSQRKRLDKINICKNLRRS